MHIQLTPYQAKYDNAIASLEENIRQGKNIQLRIVKNHFLARAVVFSKTYPCLALNTNRQVIGTAVGAGTTILINGELHTAGFVLDAKVHPLYRNKGIGRQLAKEQHGWFRREGWEKSFTTLKLSNAPVIKLSQKALGKIWLTPFVYLTIPTGILIPSTFPTHGNNSFSVRLFDKDHLLAPYYTTFSGGLAVFNTWMMYQLKIEKFSWLYRQGLFCIKKVAPRHYALLPREQELFEFSTLFNHSVENIGSINEVLQHLKAIRKPFLLVCCRKGEGIYNFLKKYSVNTYHYYMMTDFPLSVKDEVTIDVRCL